MIFVSFIAIFWESGKPQRELRMLPNLNFLRISFQSSCFNKWFVQAKYFSQVHLLLLSLVSLLMKKWGIFVIIVNYRDDMSSFYAWFHGHNETKSSVAWMLIHYNYILIKLEELLDFMLIKYPFWTDSIVTWLFVE